MLRTSLTLLIAVTMVSATVVGQDSDAEAFLKAGELQIQARLSAEQGDFPAAVRNIRSAAELTGDRQTAQRAGRMAGGGSSFADFTEILTLIQEQTSPPARWQLIDQEGGALSVSYQGVFIGSPAVLASLVPMNDNSGLMAAAEFARRANHNTDVCEPSELRLVSLPRLEAHVTALLEQGVSVPEDVWAVAGISRIEYLFVFPDSGDVVIGGPAGNWVRDNEDRRISVVNNRPTLHLDDLVTLTRTFSRDGSGFLMCTIDPKKDQVAALQDFVSKNRRSLTVQNAPAFTQELEQRLGLQNVWVRGVPQDSRVASVIVEADYRMKEIGVGRRQGPEGMKSYFDLLSRSEQRGSASMDALRWWMDVGYDAVQVAPNGQVFRLSGNAVRCLAEDQVVNAGGDRTGLGKATKANARFAELFTEHLPQLAEADPVFADLQNIFDLSMVSALTHSYGLAPKAGWVPTTFAADGSYRPGSVDVPTELMTAAHHHVYSGRHIVIQVAGGVRISAREILSDKDRTLEAPELTPQGIAASPIGQNAGRWWWDAAR